MCKVIKIGESTAIICGGHNDNEKCDEKASVYETKDGQRFYFKTVKMLRNGMTKISVGTKRCLFCLWWRAAIEIVEVGFQQQLPVYIGINEGCNYKFKIV